MENAIAELGKEHGVCDQALTDFVISFLDKRFNSGDNRNTTNPKTTRMETTKVMMKMGIVVRM